MTGEF